MGGGERLHDTGVPMAGVCKVPCVAAPWKLQSKFVKLLAILKCLSVQPPWTVDQSRKGCWAWELINSQWEKPLNSAVPTNHSWEPCTSTDADSHPTVDIGTEHAPLFNMWQHPKELQRSRGFVEYICVWFATL